MAEDRSDTGRTDAEKQGLFAALAAPNFRRYVTGRALGLIGTWVETIA
jgi:hypothetical protein